MVKAMLSAVVPAYNEEIMVPRAARVIGQVLHDAEIDYEIVFVNDGSKDGTWEQIEAACLRVLQAKLRLGILPMEPQEKNA